jgi:hypothetical protein
MGQTPGIITEILSKINYCELCDNPTASDSVCDVYTIEKFGADDTGDLSKNIIVLCPACKKNYDTGMFTKKHLKVCVKIRDPGLSDWLTNLFDSYDIRIKKDPVNHGYFGKTLNRLVNDQNFMDNAIFLFGAFIIFISFFIFSFGFNAVSYYDNTAVPDVPGDSGQYSSGLLFNIFLELTGVAFALIGMFFVLKMSHGNVKKNVVD